jgi:hypothetical protein
MLSAGIKDLKNNLSRYLSCVKKGENLLITERLVKLPSQKLNKDIPDPTEVPGKPVSEMAIEDLR